MKYSFEPLTLADYFDFLVPYTGRKYTVSVKNMLRSPSFSVRVDGRQVAAYGVISIFPGCGEAWAFFLPEAFTDRVAFFSGVKKCWDAFKTLYRRIQAHVPDIPANRRFVEHLGMRFEAALLRYGPDGETYFLYAWIR